MAFVERNATEYRRSQGHHNAPPSLPNCRLEHKQRHRKGASAPLKVARPCGRGAYPQGHARAVPTS
eukprot:1638104-Pyramimonas_sp.AAC.1